MRTIRKKQLLTQKEFEETISQFKGMAIENIAIARQVLVDGKTQSHVAKSSGITRQRINAIVKLILKTTKNVPPDWVKIEVWVPENLANEVKGFIDNLIKERFEK